MGLAGEGQEAIRCTLGPITNSLRDVDLFMRTVLGGKPWEEETSLVPLPWKEVSPTRDFTVGILWDDLIVHPHPPVQRAMKMAVDKLKAAGIKTKDWKPYKHEHGMRIINDLFYPDGAATQISALEASGEPWLPLTKEAFLLARKMTVEETWVVNLEREAYRTEHRLLMKEQGVDFILCPAYVGVAAEPHEARYFAYTAIWNILDMPGVAFPSGLKVDPELDAVESGYHARSPQDEAEYASYSPDKFVAAPIALQLVRLPALSSRYSPLTSYVYRWATGSRTKRPSLRQKLSRKLSWHEITNIDRFHMGNSTCLKSKKRNKSKYASLLLRGHDRDFVAQRLRTWRWPSYPKCCRI